MMKTAESTTTLYYDSRIVGRVTCQDHNSYSTEDVVAVDELTYMGGFVGEGENREWSDTELTVLGCDVCGKTDSRHK